MDELSNLDRKDEENIIRGIDKNNGYYIILQMNLNSAECDIFTNQ
jgi:hypothetical protein